MRKYIKLLLLALIFGISACGVKGSPQQSITPPAISVTVNRENCPSMETQVGMTVSWTNGDTVKLPIEIVQVDDAGNMTGVGKSEIGPGDVFSTKFYNAGSYRFYCSEEKKDVYGTITVK
jgi:plastocyanin